MKACIVEIKDGLAAVLTDEGCMIKVKNRSYAIGQVIELKKQRIRFPAKVIALAASAAAVVAVFGVTAWAYYTPYSYVSLDVNPSIEYTVNRFNRVLSVQAVNNDGADILSDLNLNNQTIDEAVKETVDQIETAGYFNGEDPGGIVISASSDSEESSQQLAKDLETAAEQATEDASAPVEVEAISVARQRVLEARQLGTTPGKLNLVQKLQTSMGTESSINVQEWLKKPVKDIMKAIKTAKQESKAGEPSDTSDSEESASSSVSSAAPTESESEISSSSNISGSESSVNTASKAAIKSPAAGNGKAVSHQSTDSSAASKQSASSNAASSEKGNSKPEKDTASKLNGNTASSENENNGNANKDTESSVSKGNGNSDSAGKSVSKQTGNGKSKK